MSDLLPEAPLVGVTVESGAVVIRRTAEPQSTALVLVAYRSAIEAALERADDPVRGGVILDVRSAPGRNDPDFEAELVGLHQRLATRFDPIVTLVRSSIGVLHAGRLVRQLGLSELIVRELAEAVALCGPVHDRSRHALA